MRAQVSSIKESMLLTNQEKEKKKAFSNWMQATDLLS